MYSDTWADGAQFVPKTNGRNTHNRDSSFSSLSSMGPGSPFSYTTANPQIAIHDTSDNFPGLPMQDDQSYQQMTAKAPNTVSHDAFYANYSFSDNTSVQAYANMLAPQRHRADRSNLLPPPEFPSGGSSNSRPASVASSVASDSPATPAAPEAEEGRRRNNGEQLFYLPPVLNQDEPDSCLPDDHHSALPTIPKLDRTMTDIFSDELYNPNFSITSTAPSQPSQTSTSPTHELFNSRLQAANIQHLSATQSPISSASRGRSPFRQGSPLAPTPTHNFPQTSSTPMRLNTAQQMREQQKAEQDSAQALRQTMAQSTAAGTPETISPKDAVLEFNDADHVNDFPLFPQAQGFDASQLVKTAPQATDFNMALNSSFDNYLTHQLSSAGMQVPHQYPFVGKPRQELPSGPTAAFSMTSRGGSSASLTPTSMSPSSPQRPEHVGADGGTYTCTYHGCSQRFETPALLQKHKREGHRQAHGMSGLRKPEGPTATYFNTQAGPHKCERINPSTGKPCNTIFSRPYDLTRHEDTIHNGRKQKVRCDVCTEEKTFSRADALTRHYRVCHPDLEFPGKHRKRGGAS
ncbi:hypothetical protein BD289DRAFT_361066 [Coniella lustricola]|uniref:C2H2-type domain-containing protein n=1 Tax=Coniella lustricola TaxID=2025994 RepID=A0A2T3AIY2_9PEZI|nr:hypothetical protein BD289DRAFT_361066 [Coniella lustricola]